MDKYSFGKQTTEHPQRYIHPHIYILYLIRCACYICHFRILYLFFIIINVVIIIIIIIFLFCASCLLTNARNSLAPNQWMYKYMGLDSRAKVEALSFHS